MTMTPMTTSSDQRGVRSHPEHAFDLATVLADKVATGTTVSACIPARNEDATVGFVVAAIRGALIDGAIAAHGHALVDEIVVVDDHSTDGTAAVARAAGARVVDAASVLAHHGEGHGKGEALWKSVHESTGDIVVWVDADIVDFDPDFILGMVGALISDPEIDFVKGHYHRPEAHGVGGGRVTELLARPLLSLYFPELAEIAQPLAGEYAGRRTLLERLPFVVGYGVDVALLIDAVRIAGIERIAQVDLGVRHHRNRTLDELGPQALAVGQAILDRAGVRPPGTAVLHRPGKDPLPVPMHERPPLSSL
ncbi:glucosyl-3-phosphoglycerate synthase [Aquihabitans sp. McL0605]|uniref:glucosyl-3-phosphoglycerate synthase n=1 Tax=Aquihabitans sp. McL0605 TaxID=3415671 RepID=UPI003CF1722D